MMFTALPRNDVVSYGHKYKKDKSKDLSFLMSASTYLPGQLPAKYFQRK